MDQFHHQIAFADTLEESLKDWQDVHVIVKKSIPNVYFQDEKPTSGTFQSFIPSYNLPAPISLRSSTERKFTASQENLLRDTKKIKESIYNLFHGIWEKRIHSDKNPQKKKTKEQQDALKVDSYFFTILTLTEPLTRIFRVYPISSSRTSSSKGRES